MNSVVNQEPNIIPLDLNNNMHRKLVIPLTHKPTRASNDKFSCIQNNEAPINEERCECMIEVNKFCIPPCLNANPNLNGQTCENYTYNPVLPINSMQSSLIQPMNFINSMPNTFCNNNFSLRTPTYQNCMENTQYDKIQYSESKLRGLQYSQYFAPVEENDASQRDSGCK